MGDGGVQAAWESLDLVKRAIARGHLSSPAETAGVHLMRIGPQDVLRESALDMYWAVLRMCKFAETTAWKSQRKLLDRLVHQFFKKVDSSFGWYDVLTHRQKATERQRPGSGITLTESEARPYYLAPARDLPGCDIVLGGVKLPGEELPLAYRDGERREGLELTALAVQRTLRSATTKVWSERWYFLASRDADEADLRSGLIPAQVPLLQGEPDLRTTPILSLFRLSPVWRGAKTRVAVFTLELHPGTGMIVSIRSMPNSFANALTLSPHVHDLLLQALTEPD